MESQQANAGAGIAMTDEPLSLSVFTKAIEQIRNQPLRPSTIILSPPDGIRYEVMCRPESWSPVRKPLKLRGRAAWGWIGYWQRNRKDWDYPPTIRSTVAAMWRELRKNQHDVLTEAAAQEINERIERIGR